MTSVTAPLDKPHVYVIAGEASGDLIGSQLFKAFDPQVRLSGVGGSQMIAVRPDFKSLFPLSDLSVMGLWEILPALLRIFDRWRQIEADIASKKPQVVVTIDSPGFNFRLAKKLKKQGIPVVHYVAPTVWAWRPGRAKKVARFLTHLLTLFPFEPTYFRKEGLSTTFVGHPLIEQDFPIVDKERFLPKPQNQKDKFLLCLLPGSRQGEVMRLLPIFLKALTLLQKRGKSFHVLLPVVPHLQKTIKLLMAETTLPYQLITDSQEKRAAMAASDIALAASGTVALELGLAGTPMVIAYQVHPITAWVARRLMHTPYFCLVNILLQRPLVPELMQENCTPEKLVAALENVLQNSTQKEELPNIRSHLGGGDRSPSQKAVAVIMNIADQKE